LYTNLLTDASSGSLTTWKQKICQLHTNIETITSSNLYCYTLACNSVVDQYAVLYNTFGFTSLSVLNAVMSDNMF